MRIDHVIWVAEDLHPAADRLAYEHGLPDGGGGRHVGIGTHNRVFPLGGGYLEVLAIADQEEAAASTIGRAVAAAPDGLFAWAVAVDDVPAAHFRYAGDQPRLFVRRQAAERIDELDEHQQSSARFNLCKGRR